MDAKVVLPERAKRNIETIAQVEQELHRRRSRVELISDGIGRFFGSLRFIFAHALFFTAWIAWNVGLFAGVPFDPYPFPFLGFIIGIEFIFLTTFVLMNQNVQARRQEHWAHLVLQVCMLSEHEITKNMQMLHLLCRHLDVKTPVNDKEVRELAKATSVTALVEEIEKSREANEVPGQAR